MHNDDNSSIIISLPTQETFKRRHGHGRVSHKPPMLWSLDACLVDSLLSNDTIEFSFPSDGHRPFGDGSDPHNSFVMLGINYLK